MARPSLPIDDALPAILSALRSASRLVIAAPPGAGKTTRVPLAMLDAPGLIERKIVLLEPRRIAARAAAHRIAEQLGEPLGETVGLSTRLERKVSAATRIEVVTDGLFTRRILADPGLEGMGAVLFDEAHERSLNIDLALALACETQSVFREDLKLVIMSATLDTERISGVLDAETVESAGRMFPVETRYAGRPRDRLDDHMAAVIGRALRDTDGSVLAFLPGAAEIRRVAERLEGNVPGDVSIHPLFGALSPAEQDAAIQRAPSGTRKIVLATDIAESALTIEGVRVVVDAGLARVPEAGGRAGATRLVTQRASLASVDQRRGRAGRTAPGVCFRLWDEPETRGLARHRTPEILRAELSSLVLALADWGETDPGALTWLDPPPAGPFRGAQARLRDLGAIDAGGAITDKGRTLASLPLDPGLAALIVSQPDAGSRSLAAEMAALMSERGLGGSRADLNQRLAGFRRDRSARASALKRQASQWVKGAGRAGADGGDAAGQQTGASDAATCLLRAWPGALARRRSGEGATYLMASGAAARLDESDPLAKHDWLVVAESIGSGRAQRITLAAPIDEADALAICPPEQVETARFDPAGGSFVARRIKRVGAIVLSETPLPAPSGPAAQSAILDAVAEHGFGAIGAGEAVDALLARIALLNRTLGAPWPDWSAGEIAASAAEWLPLKGAKLPAAKAVVDALVVRLPWPLPRELDEFAPTHIALPSGRKAPVDYTEEQAPLVEARVQEVFGSAPHPAIAKGRVPVTLSLLSPARRQVALTADLPGFWAGGYGDMAKDMRAQYPKHDWPEAPDTARPHPGHTKARILQSRR